MSERVQVVVGQLQLLEGDQLPHPVRPRGRGVRMDVEPPGHSGLCLPGHRPDAQGQQHMRNGLSKRASTRWAANGLEKVMHDLHILQTAI